MSELRWGAKWLAANLVGIAVAGSIVTWYHAKSPNALQQAQQREIASTYEVGTSFCALPAFETPSEPGLHERYLFSRD